MSGVLARGSKHYAQSACDQQRARYTDSWVLECEGAEACFKRVCEYLKILACILPWRRRIA